MRNAQRGLESISQGVAGHEPTALAITELMKWLERAERIRTQQRHSKNKLYALHAPEVECIGKGKARKPYEFGVLVSLAVTHQHGVMAGVRSFPGNPNDGHTRAEQLEQANTLLQDIGVKPAIAVVDLGFRGVDAAGAPVQIIHRGKFKSLDVQQRRWFKRRQAIAPAIGHTKSDNRMDRCWLGGSSGDALHAVRCCAVRRRVQHPLAAARDHRQGAGGPSFALLADAVTCAMHRQPAANCSASRGST